MQIVSLLNTPIKNYLIERIYRASREIEIFPIIFENVAKRNEIFFFQLTFENKSVNATRLRLKRKLSRRDNLILSWEEGEKARIPIRSSVR